MILQPVLHPVLLAILAIPVLVLAVLALVRSRRGERVWWGLRLVMLLACVFMVLRPGIPGGTTQTLATDTDIVLVVDTTASIVAEDWGDGEPRLDGVRADVQKIVDEYPGARFALITFDAAAQLRLPLTTDASALTSSLEVLTPEVTTQSRGSSIGIANQMLEDTLSQAAGSSPDRSRMVFYFGDGEQTVSSSVESFAGSAQYVDGGAVLGYGTAEGGPMKITSGDLSGTDSGYIEYQGGEALSVLDESTLQTIADELGVTYQHRTADAEIALPDAPTTTTSYTDSGSTGNVIELYWIGAVVVVLALGAELVRGTMLVVRMRGLSRADAQAPSIPPAGGGSE